MSNHHLHEELASNSERISVQTRYGIITGGRAYNGAAVFLEVPYALQPKRFSDPVPLPEDYRYEAGREYVYEAGYCYQPRNDGQAGDTKFEDKVGLGKPTENPLFTNIVAPPTFPSKKDFPVKVYIHGGFLQFGSPHGLKTQNQYIAAERDEVHVSIGYRLSAFGFLACDEPKIAGNFGFKDQWLALEWVKSNIHTFGGDPSNIAVQGLSAGAHSVHQILHHASRLPPGVDAPFQSALIMSNAIVLPPKKPSELRPQFEALCRALELSPTSPSILSDLQSAVSPERICDVIETDAVGTEHGTFRGCVDDDWLTAEPDAMAWQRSGRFAKSLKEKGVKSIILGETSEEWYLYSIAHPISRPADIVPNLERYFPADIVAKIVKLYRTLTDDSGPEESARLFGEILCDYQVYLPIRILARDLHRAGFPVLRYQFRWTPEKVRPTGGWVTHGTDAAIWHFRIPSLDEAEATVAKQWIQLINDETQKLEAAREPLQPLSQVFALREDRSIEWIEDSTWDEKMRLLSTLPGEMTI